MALLANQESSSRALANHGATSKYQFEVTSKFKMMYNRIPRLNNGIFSGTFHCGNIAQNVRFGVNILV